jgi:Periplasmic component of the Tol biopolymer transport system
MLSDGTGQAQLTHLGGRALFSDFSPDGTRIAFGGTEGDDSNTEIYAVDATTGSGLVALTSCAKLGHSCSNDYPAYSPDGREIVFIHTDDFDASENPINAQVWVMNADGSHQHPLTTDSLPKDQVPNWSPDGSTIVFSRGTVDDEGIWVMAKDGSGQRQLTGCRSGEPSPCAAGDDFGPVWSPDGKQIAFLRAFGAVGPNDRPIFVMNADGSEQHRLVPGVILQAVPSWQQTGVAAGG